MKNIKFRAWVRIDRVMKQVSCLDFDFNLISFDDETDEFVGDDVPMVILMRYIGIKDSQGTDIYEGDIIKISKPNGYSHLATIPYFGRENYSAFNLNSKRMAPDWHYELNVLNWYLINSNKENGPTLTVIGNIYENPELLEDKPNE